MNGSTDNYVYAYDTLGQLLTVTKNATQTESYTYDENSNRLTSATGGESREYVYDDDDRLEGYDSDADGNLDGALDVEYEYDADGYLTSMTDGSGTTYYDYSSRGELLSVTLPDTTVIEYLHDVSGNPIERRVDSVLTHRYFWGSKTQLLAYWEYNASGTQIHETYVDPGNGITRDGTKYFLAHDQVGSVRAVINTTGTIIKEIDYDSFGNILSDTDPSFYMPLGFARGFTDAATGLIRFGYRDYDPNVGRWTAKDPIFFDGGQANLYVYVGNSPVMYIDPLGLQGSKRPGRSQSTGAGALAFLDALFSTETFFDMEKGLAAAVDGMIPFYDDFFKDVYADENGCVKDVFLLSRLLGRHSRDLLAAATGMKASQRLLKSSLGSDEVASMGGLERMFKGGALKHAAINDFIWGAEGTTVRGAVGQLAFLLASGAISIESLKANLEEWKDALDGVEDCSCE